MKESFPDTQFWNRTSDPVLSGDPFSSLMWVIFCLPYPFLSCEESMLSLVHVFYAVSVVQAIITHCGIHHCKTSELGLNDCLISDISKVLGESGCAQQYFVSRYIGSSSNIRDTIRSLSFPYLRRCALLWKLLDASAPAPFYDRDNVFDRSSVAINDMMDITDGSLIEFNEIQQLENLFKIPLLDVVLKEEILRPLALLIKQCCPDCKTSVGEPALCLLCGILCSSSWKSCCSQSGCQAHAMVCGAGTGVFLLIRRTTILLQRSARQAPWPSPYLDTFGEEDIDMHRGKPLYLNEERYAALTYMVASHGLDRSSKAVQNFE